MAAALLLWDRNLPGGWVGPVFVAIVLWALLNGSRIAWWAQVLGVSASVYSTWGRLGAPDLVPFVDPAQLWLLAGLLGLSLPLMFLPSVRAYRRDIRPIGRVALICGAILISAFVSHGLRVDSRIPASGLLEPVRRGRLVGVDSAEGVAYYITRIEDRLCLVEVRTSGYQPHC